MIISIKNPSDFLHIIVSTITVGVERFEDAKGIYYERRLHRLRELDNRLY
ncbi:protein of unknown function [Mesotoga infera]|uniref:Uncharacterized protein n=1 Tax=Mesotoga infera TaxID=1236046 RepID=A0A7Z7LDH8_9BACT|nr:protein of unknown function [Mesotoga infera]